MADQQPHHSGFVNILGKPNMGKSTLLNALVGEKMSVITAKPQTTRHRIIGILNGEGFQIVFSDTPGFVDQPAYRMHKMMNAYVNLSFDDADIILFLTDPFESLDEQHLLLKRIALHSSPVIGIINKKDLVTEDQLLERKKALAQFLPGKTIHSISALTGEGVAELMEYVVSLLPEGVPYYPDDQLTDRTERFFVSEIIRANILELYREEIPYSCEVVVESFSEGDSRTGPIVRINAVIYTLDERKKMIMLGKNGSAIKQLGTNSRKEIEAFVGKRVFLELNIKVRENWRDDEDALRSFGYQN